MPKDGGRVPFVVKVHINLKQLVHTFPNKEERSRAGVFVVFIVVFCALSESENIGLLLLVSFFFVFCFCARKVCLRN